MATRITIKGQVTIPKSVREALQLAAGDAVEFKANAVGEFVLHKARPTTPAARRLRAAPRGNQAQIRRRAAELLALLDRLD
jgi:antitoxin PrlF